MKLLCHCGCTFIWNTISRISNDGLNAWLNDWFTLDMTDKSLVVVGMNGWFYLVTHTWETGYTLVLKSNTSGVWLIDFLPLNFSLLLSKMWALHSPRISGPAPLLTSAVCSSRGVRRMPIKRSERMPVVKESVRCARVDLEYVVIVWLQKSGCISANQR